MRTIIPALAAATILAVTAVTGFTAGGAPTDPIQKHHVRSGGVGTIGQGGFLRGGEYKLVRSDMTGTGGGHGMGKGGMMGDMMGGMGKGKGQ